MYLEQKSLLYQMYVGDCIFTKVFFFMNTFRKILFLHFISSPHFILENCMIFFVISWYYQFFCEFEEAH